MAIYTYVCIGDVDENGTCLGQSKFVLVATLTPQPEPVMTLEIVETMFLSAVSVLLLATAFKVTRKQFFR